MDRTRRTHRAGSKKLWTFVGLTPLKTFPDNDDNNKMYQLILDYSRAEANPPHPFKKVEAVAHEDVVDYLEGATTKAL